MRRSSMHPGEHLALQLKELGMSAAELARKLDVPATRITEILNGHHAVTEDTALRLGRFFGTSAQFWLDLQKFYYESMLGQYIPLHYHYQMLQDESRMLAFKEAIRLVVPPGGKVLELGGGTGALSFFAARQASRIWYVERQPILVAKTKELLDLNPHSGAVEVIQADAFDYLPPEPVDTVICEMLHSALLREKQAELITSFKKRYAARFGSPFPIFLPEATILGVEPVCQDFNFSGYHAPIPFFQAVGESPKTISLSSPVVYAIVQYSLPFSVAFQLDRDIQLNAGGNLNALRFITSNALAILMEEKRTINWMNQNLILPLHPPLVVRAGDTLNLRFSYRAGDEIESLMESIEIRAKGNEERQSRGFQIGS